MTPLRWECWGALSGSSTEEFVDQFELLTSREEFASIYALAADMLALARDPRSEALARFYLGLAYVNVAQTLLGIRNIRRARATFEDLGDERMVVECLDWEATAIYLNEGADALSLEKDALRRCRMLRPVPEATIARIHGHLGAIHIGLHDWANAIRSYEAALASSERIKDLGRLARMYNDLSIAFLETGDEERSLSYARRALAIHSMARDEISIARVENNLGLALMRHGMLAEAEERIRRSLEISERLRLDHGRAHVLLSLGELNIRLGDYAQAFTYLSDAAELARTLDERMTLAVAYQWLGWLHDRSGNDADADSAFLHALTLLSEPTVDERLAECHVQYAHVLESRGDLTGAVSQWKRAMDLVQAATRPNEPSSFRADRR